MILKIKLNTQETDEVSGYIYQVSKHTTQPGLESFHLQDGFVCIDSSVHKEHPECYFEDLDGVIDWDYYLGEAPNFEGEIYVETIELFTDNLVSIRKWERNIFYTIKK